MRQAHAHKAMLQFRIGDRVAFHPEGEAPVFGMLTRYNKRSVTVITDDGRRWNVAPGFLKPADSSYSAKMETNHRNAVIPFKQK